MKWLLALALPALFISCADQPFATVPPPPRAKIVDVRPAREAVVRASEETTKSREQIAKAEVQLDRAAESVKDAGEIAREAFEKGMTAGSKLADRLRTSINRIAAELADARKTIAKLRVSLEKSAADLETAKGSIADVQADAAVKQSEVESVRSSLDTVNGRLESSEKKRATEKTEKTAQKVLKRLWRAAAVIGWGIILIVVAWKLFVSRRIPRVT